MVPCGWEISCNCKTIPGLPQMMASPWSGPGCPLQSSKFDSAWSNEKHPWKRKWNDVPHFKQWIILQMVFSALKKLSFVPSQNHYKPCSSNPSESFSILPSHRGSMSFCFCRDCFPRAKDACLFPVARELLGTRHSDLFRINSQFSCKAIHNLLGQIWILAYKHLHFTLASPWPYEKHKKQLQP